MSILSKTTIATVAVLMAVTLTGCATISEIPDSKRVKSDEFDKTYIFKTSPMVKSQTVINQRFNCWSETRGATVTVKDGVMSHRYRNEWYRTNVDAEGRFRLEIPTTISYTRLGPCLLYTSPSPRDRG